MIPNFIFGFRSKLEIDLVPVQPRPSFIYDSSLKSDFTTADHSPSSPSSVIRHFKRSPSPIQSSLLPSLYSQVLLSSHVTPSKLLFWQDYVYSKGKGIMSIKRGGISIRKMFIIKVR